MKLYPNLVKAITEALEEIFVHGVHADIAVEQTLKKDARWGARDRKFIAGYIYDIVRWYRLFKACLSDEQQGQKLNYHLFAVAHLLRGFELPLWPEFEGINAESVKEAHSMHLQTRKLKASIPDWLDDMGVAQFGEQVWEKEIVSLNQEAQVFIRTNNLKTTSAKLIEALRKENVEVAPVNHQLFEEHKTDQPLLIVKRQRLQQLESFKNGLFEIQDAASQLIAPYMQLQAGMKVIDACAGAGGKALHMAGIMQNKGSILALDKESKKLEELEKRAQRAGVRIITTRLASKQEIEKNKSTADRLLLDVPCSGLGVLRRNPDAKWKLSPQFINEVRQTQSNILHDYSTMLKPGGLMIYATCSILAVENQLQVEHFLSTHAGKFELISQQSIMPSEGFDGFYMASLKKIA